MFYLDTSQWAEHLSLGLFHSTLDTETGVQACLRAKFPILPALFRELSSRRVRAHSSRLAGERRSSQLSLK